MKSNSERSGASPTIGAHTLSLYMIYIYIYILYIYTHPSLLSLYVLAVMKGCSTPSRKEAQHRKHEDPQQSRLAQVPPAGDDLPQGGEGRCPVPLRLREAKCGDQGAHPGKGGQHVRQPEVEPGRQPAEDGRSACLFRRTTSPISECAAPSDAVESVPVADRRLPSLRFLVSGRGDSIHLLSVHAPYSRHCDE